MNRRESLRAIGLGALGAGTLSTTTLLDSCKPTPDKTSVDAKPQPTIDPTDAGVPDFIEFIVKDEPQHQLPMRGGLRWLDLECLDRFEKDFVTCTPQQQP